MYRFSVAEDGTILRGRLFRMIDPDSWRYYWDSDSLVAFYNEGGYYDRGLRPCTENEDTERAITACRMATMHGTDPHDALKRLAVRLTDHVSYDADFIRVPLDRGTDLYVHAWSGDPEGAWRDEIEAVWNNDVYRIEVEEYQQGMGTGGDDWVPSDGYPEEFYGESQAEREFANIFDLDAFPAEHTIESGE